MAKAELKLLILLIYTSQMLRLLTSKHWDYRHAPPHPAVKVFEELLSQSDKQTILTCIYSKWQQVS